MRKRKTLKEQKEELLRSQGIETWHHRWPGGIVSRNVTGDMVVAERFNGEAKALLYEVKNALKVGHLNQLSRTRQYPDGTVIRAISSFGRDTVFIDTTKSFYAGYGICKCEIELIDPPTVIQPGRYPEVIGTGVPVEGRGLIPVEVEGVDYFKTYYRLKSLGYCDPIDWTVCTTEELQVDASITHGAECVPFNYQTPPEPYYPGDTTTTPPIPPDPNRHCIYSMWDHCQGEILSVGQDEGGKYIIWKAYTEWSNLGWEPVEFSRTGLGYMKLKAFIKDKVGTELCYAEAIVKVDCCEKPEENRVVRMWWEWITEGQGFMFVGGSQFWPCPDHMNKYRLFDYYTLDTGSFYIFPTIEGACLPYTWKLTGAGELRSPGMFYASMQYYFEGNPYTDEISCAPIIIEVEDRCGTKDRLVADCCPEVDGTISIAYTSLSQPANTEQELSVSGARISNCPPYVWTITAGSGTITPRNPSGDVVDYLSPATNANCANNPTITVTDCCGHSASISMAVNASPGATPALRECSYVECANSCPATNWKGTFCETTWDCDGHFIEEIGWDGNGLGFCGECDLPNMSNLTCPVSSWTDTRCGAIAAGMCDFPDQPCGTFWDIRTVAMKATGCCPINPFTGLPY